jgi:hypothetical protein
VPAKYPKHAKLLQVAAAEIGTREIPMGSNRGPRVEAYQRATWLGGSGWPWCAAFVCFCAERAGFTLKYRGAGAYAWYDDGAQIVGKRIPASRPQDVTPGDFVVFRIGSGHIGIVEKIQGPTVLSIDGNTSDQVARRERPLTLVYGFIHLTELAAPPKKTPKPPIFEVVGSESGHRVIYVSGARAIGKRLARFLKKYPAGVTVRRRRKKAP